MTTTPTIWKSTFTANIGATAGGQTVPRTIGLANGNFLTVWEDNTNGTGPFTDIMGRMFTPEGNAIGTPFQINSAVVGSDETGPKIIAMPDGGYVVAYGSYLDALGGFIGIERFDANGFSVSSRFITDPNSSLTKWEITADDLGNYTVVYEKLALHALPYPQVGTFFSQDIFATTYDYLTNAAGAETALVAQNSGEKDDLGAIDSFASGKLITFYNEPDYDFFGNQADTAEFSIIDPLTGVRTRNPVEIDGPNWDDDAYAIDVACLAYGPFVLLYSFNGTYAFRIGADEASGTAISSRNTVATFGGLGGARVVAMNEGGFFIEWLETNAHILYGQRYAATGAPIGALLIIANNVGSIGETDMSMTSDGRILVPFKDISGEVGEVILDPRENIIYGTDLAEALTAQTTSSIVYGFDGDDSLYGQNGSDRLDGGLRLDTLYGGNGNDTFILNDANRFTSYAYDTVVEYANGGGDTIEVMSFYRESKSSAIPSGYMLADNVENGRIMGVDIFWLFGNELANYLTGNAAANVLDGKAGVDVMNGLQGSDDYFVDVTGDVVIEFAGQGVADHVFAALSYGLAAGQEIELFSTTDAAGIGTIALTGNEFAQTITGNAGANRLNGGLDAVKDVLIGLGGNDYYIINSSSDDIVEAVGGGSDDRAQTTVSFTLGAGDNVEVLQTSNAGLTTAINLTGNEFAQSIYGNAAGNILNGGIDALRDTLIGYAGNDLYMINSAVDIIVEGVGGGTADRVQASVSFALAADDNIELMQTTNAALTAAINLTGNALAQAIYGNAGVNVLNGGIDALRDTLIGYGGSDLYVINSALDVIVEAVGGGTADRVRASVSFTLAADDNIEFFETTNAAGLTALNLTGNALAQSITGNAGANTLSGGLGNDSLTGLGGSDNFLFNTTPGATNHDTITDFNVGADTIQLDNAIFTALAATGVLGAGLFENTSLGGQSGSEVIVYDRANGDLYYDTNGATAGGLVLFADVANGTVLTNADFVVV